MQFYLPIYRNYSFLYLDGTWWLGSIPKFLSNHLIEKTQLGCNLVGKQTPRNSSLEDWARVKYMKGCIGGLLDALR